MAKKTAKKDRGENTGLSGYLALICGALVLAFGIGYAACYLVHVATLRTGRTNAVLYADAVADAAVAREDELHSLVQLGYNEQYVSWNKDMDRVLLLTWHDLPDSLPKGETQTVEEGDAVWCVTPDELIAWYRDNKGGVNDWTLRFEQLFGLPEDSGYTHFSLVWVKPEDVIRPAYEPNPEAQVTSLSFADDADRDFVDWFNARILLSYYQSALPWTRLGYTYDWADGGEDYGLTSFLLREGVSFTVEDTLSNADFLLWLEEKAG